MLYLGWTSERLVLIMIVIVVTLHNFIPLGVEKVANIRGVFRLDFVLFDPLGKSSGNVSV